MHNPQDCYYDKLYSHDYVLLYGTADFEKENNQVYLTKSQDLSKAGIRKRSQRFEV